MDFKAIEDMIKVMNNSTVGYLEINWQGNSIIMKKQGESDTNTSDSRIDTPIDKTNNEKSKDVDEQEVKQDEIKDENIKEIVSPIVGTFYSRSAPDSPDYVSVGDKVKKGDTLCIIEAMKIMNEIQSDVDGEIVDVSPKNQDMVEYGQVLFKIKVA